MLAILSSKPREGSEVGASSIPMSSTSKGSMESEPMGCLADGGRGGGSKTGRSAPSMWLVILNRSTTALPLASSLKPFAYARREAIEHVAKSAGRTEGEEREKEDEAMKQSQQANR